MKYIIKPRGYGKTADLIRISADSGKLILCLSNAQTEYIVDKAKLMKLDIPDPINLHSNFEGRDLSNGILIDEVEQILRYLLAQKGISKIDAVTLSLDDSI